MKNKKCKNILCFFTSYIFTLELSAFVLSMLFSLSFTRFTTLPHTLAALFILCACSVFFLFFFYLAIIISSASGKSLGMFSIFPFISVYWVFMHAVEVSTYLKHTSSLQKKPDFIVAMPFMLPLYHNSY